MIDLEIVDLGPHAVFIIGAYAFALLVIGGLILNIILDTKQQRRKLATLEAQGIKRRSQQAKIQHS